jgi:F-type H+-transporting ATPase subunit b
MIDFNISNYLRISFSDVILVLISTCIIILFAKKFFWSKLLAYMEKRQNLIQENIDASAQLKKEAAELKNQYDEKMKDAGKEAHAIMETAKEQANVEKDKILTDAKAQAGRIKEAAYEEIERDKLKAEKEMKAAISDVAIAAASQLLKKEVDDDVQREYIDTFIAEAGNEEW